MDIGKIKCALGLHQWDGGKCTRMNCSKTRDKSHDIQEPQEHLRLELERVEQAWVGRESKLKVELLEQLELLLSAEGALERWQWPERREELGLEQQGQRARQRQGELVQELEHLRQERERLRQELEQLSLMLKQLRLLKRGFREESARKLVIELERLPPELKQERLQWELVRELVRLERLWLERERSEQEHPE